MPRIDFKIKRHDTAPDFVVDLTAAGLPADLTGVVSVTFHMVKGGVVKVSHAAVVDPDQTAHKGRVKYQWQTGDTDTRGTYKAEFEADFGSGVLQTYPNDKDLRVLVVPDLA